ncbi:MAG TPA: hypothetical protein VLT47_10190 [Anaeromyxobacteraceae bacterium]|nr:hypothetical protein [Anaeromyxobacteraceae bacterium]
MADRSPLHLLAVYGPLLLIGLAAGALRALGQRPGLPDGARRAYGISWVLLVLVGTPFWLLLAATLRL